MIFVPSLKVGVPACAVKPVKTFVRGVSIRHQPSFPSSDCQTSSPVALRVAKGFSGGASCGSSAVSRAVPCAFSVDFRSVRRVPEYSVNVRVRSASVREYGQPVFRAMESRVCWS